MILFLFADTGGEKPETYRYLPVIQSFLKEVKFPPVVTVRYEPKTALYSTTLGGTQCLHTGTLPSIAYRGARAVRLKYKVPPAERATSRPSDPLSAEFVKSNGGWVVRAIGFDAGEERRTYAGVVKAIGLDAGELRPPADLAQGEGRRRAQAEPRGVARRALQLLLVSPLPRLRMDRGACERAIRAAGLPVPVKSACFFCPASKKPEIVRLRAHHPDLLARALALEANARPSLTSVVGLGRSFAWADFLADLDDTPLFDCGT